MLIRLKLCLLLAAWCVTSALYGAPDIENLKNSLVTVVVQSGGIQHQSVGIALGNEQVLATRPEQKRNLQFSIKPWSSNAVLLATPSEKDAKIGHQAPLMILHVPGLSLSAASFLSTEAVAGLPAYTPLAQEDTPGGTQGDSYEIKSGALTDILEFQPLSGFLFKKPQGPVLRLVPHNVLVTATRFGSPVVNACGQVVAVSIADPRHDKAQRARDPQDVMVALLTTQIMHWLQTAEIEIDSADTECLGAEQQTQEAQQQAQEAQQQAQEAQQQTQEAQQQAQEAQQQAQEAEGKAQEAQQKKQEAQQQVQEAQQKKQEAQQQAQEAQQKKQEAQQQAQAAEGKAQEAQQQTQEAQQQAQAAEENRLQAEKDLANTKQALQDQIQLYGGIAVAGLLLLLLLWLLSNQKKKAQLKTEREKVAEAEHKVQKAAMRLAPFDCILEGQDADGKRHLLKLHKAALGDAEGVILGRNPRNATFIIGHEEISREHARLSIDNNMLYVHDLGSANGTRVDNKVLSAQDSARLVDGATLDIGPIRFTVKLVF